MSHHMRFDSLLGRESSSGQAASLGDLLRDIFRLPEKDQSSADQFASWLPYSAYIPDEQIFVNRDGLGFMLEIMPQSGADERMVEVLLSLYSTCPPYTGIQFNLFGSPHIQESLRRYANLRVEDADQLEKAQHWGRAARNDNLFRNLARARVDHYLRSAHQSVTSGFSYTIRDFRLMMSVCVPGDAGDANARDELIALRAGMRAPSGVALRRQERCRESFPLGQRGKQDTGGTATRVKPRSRRLRYWRSCRRAR